VTWTAGYSWPVATDCCASDVARRTRSTHHSTGGGTRDAEDLRAALLAVHVASAHAYTCAGFMSPSPKYLLVSSAHWRWRWRWRWSSAAVLLTSFTR
jgi:hypothetical protein